MGEVHITIDSKSPEAAAAREIALRLVAAGNGGSATYSQEITGLVREILSARTEAELGRRIVLMLDAVTTYAAVGILLLGEEWDASPEDAMRVVEKGVDGFINRADEAA